jgi:hypothetical protein
MQYVDLTVWIDCPVEVAAQHGIERDRKRGVDENHILEWEKNWIPKDKAFYTLHKPDVNADFLFEAYT